MMSSVVLLGAMAASLTPAVLWAAGGQSGEPSAVIAGAARMMGRCGVVLLMWQFVLGLRSAARLLTPDLLGFNRVHQWLGVSGVVLVAAHPGLLLVASGEPLLQFFALGVSDRTDVAISFGKLALGLLAVTWVSSVVARHRLGFRRWRRLHLVNYAVLPLVLVHSFHGPSFEEGALRHYWMGLAVGAAGLVLGRALHATGIGQPPYEVVDVESVARSTRRIGLMPIARIVRPVLGQFVYVQLERFGEAHPFTVSNFDDRSGALSITPKAVGPFSRRLHSLEPGHRVWVSGPFGVFAREASTTDRPVVLVAGGIGITPFMRILRARRRNLGTAPLTLIYSNKSPADAAFRYEIDALASVTHSIKVVHVFSQTPTPLDIPATAEVAVECGRVDERLLRAHLSHAPEAGEYFVCGPPAMMDAVMAALGRLGTPARQIHSERFSF